MFILKSLPFFANILVVTILQSKKKKQSKKLVQAKMTLIVDFES